MHPGFTHTYVHLCNNKAWQCIIRARTQTPQASVYTVISWSRSVGDCAPPQIEFCRLLCGCLLSVNSHMYGCMCVCVCWLHLFPALPFALRLQLRWKRLKCFPMFALQCGLWKSLISCRSFRAAPLPSVSCCWPLPFCRCVSNSVKLKNWQHSNCLRYPQIEPCRPLMRSIMEEFVRLWSSALVCGCVWLAAI